MMNRAIITLLVLSLLGSRTVFVSGLSPPHCWDFVTGVHTDWERYFDNKYTYDWKFTVDDDFPDDLDIPSFQPYTHTVSYTWFQDQDSFPIEGEIRTTALVTLDVGDVISATIYRHILDGTNDSYRPAVRFTQTDVDPVRTVDLVYNEYYDQWDTLSAFSCDVAAPVHTICCEPSYPCSGYLQIDGQVLIRDELLAISKVELNSGCSEPTPPPTPGPCDCSFGTDYCTWEHCNWYNSATVPPTIIPPSPSGDSFVYIINESGMLLLSAEISISTSTFSFDYYLDSTGSSELLVSFISTSRARYPVTGANPLPQTGGVWTTTGPLNCSDCCGGSPSCNGTFEVAAYYTFPFDLYAAVDTFVGSFDSCPNPAPPPSSYCSYDFNLGISNWSPYYVGDGWIWSAFEPSPNVPASPSGTPFIYIHDTIAAAWFPATATYPYAGYVDITPCAILSFNYYLTGYSGNSMTVSFRYTSGTTVTIATFPATSMPTWKNTGPLYIPICTVYPCPGQIVIATQGIPQTVINAGIDDFTLTGAVYNGFYCS